MAADRVEIGPAVVVEVREMRSPADRWETRHRSAERFARVFEERALDVAVVAVRLPSEVRHEEVGPTIAVRVADRYTHSRARARAEDARSGFRGRLLESAVAPVVKEAIRDAIVDEVEVGPPVPVVIENGDAECLRLRRWHRKTRFLRDVGEPAVAVVAEEMRRLAHVVLGNAELELGLRPLPLGGRVEIVGDDDVHVTVAVVVEEGRSDREERILQAASASFLEPPVSAVDVELVRTQVRQVEIEVTVPVDVDPERSHSESARVNARGRRDVVETPFAAVPVQATAALLVRFSPARNRVGHVEVGKPVAVGVPESAAAVDGRDHLQMPEIGPETKTDPGGPRHVAKDAGAVGSGERRAGSGEQGDRRGAQSSHPKRVSLAVNLKTFLPVVLRTPRLASTQGARVSTCRSFCGSKVTGSSSSVPRGSNHRTSMLSTPSATRSFG